MEKLEISLLQNVDLYANFLLRGCQKKQAVEKKVNEKMLSDEELC